ncbi:hypothetical protein GGI12_000791 [Dipsacomyces acuminosporus]|nr:hypothetical protein GGI12_000791 [Dipsacomyces acuminosporus]
MYYPPSKCAVIALQLLEYQYLEVEISPFAPPEWMESHVWRNQPLRAYPCARAPSATPGKPPLFICGTMQILSQLHRETGKLPPPQDEHGRAALATLLYSLGALHCYTLALLSSILQNSEPKETYMFRRSRLWKWVQIINDVLLSADAGSGGPSFGGLYAVGIAEVAGAVYTGPLHTYGGELGLEPPQTPEYKRYYVWREHAMCNPYISRTAQLSRDIANDKQFQADHVFYLQA